MGRLVDLDKVMELFHVAESCDKCQRSNIDCDSERTSYYTPRDVCGLLDLAEEADAVPVVRCKDCTYWDKTDSEMGRCWCTVHAAMTRPDWFCWAGYPWEEQEEEDDDG